MYLPGGLTWGAGGGGVVVVVMVWLLKVAHPPPPPPPSPGMPSSPTTKHDTGSSQLSPQSDHRLRQRLHCGKPSQGPGSTITTTERESERETWGRAGIDSVCLYGSVPRSATQARPPTHPLEGGYYAATASSLPSSSINHNYMTRGPSSPTTNSLTNR